MLNVQSIESPSHGSYSFAIVRSTNTNIRTATNTRVQSVQRRTTWLSQNYNARDTVAKPAVAATPRPAQPAAQLNEQDQRLADLMNAAQAGDRAAFENLIRASIPFIKMVARGQGVPADFIDDVVQETMLTIHRIRDTFDLNRSFTAWLRMIAQRRAIDVMRSQGRNFLREVHEPLAFENHSDPTSNPENDVDELDRKSLLGVAVATLPVRQREAVEQIALNGKTLADAALATGLTPGALKVNLHRALNTLRAQVRNGMTTSARALATLNASEIEHTFVNSAV